jgi:hypothetical protein
MNNCNRNYTICGWCQEKTIGYKNKCVHCFRFLKGNNQKEPPIKLNKLDTMAIYADAKNGTKLNPYDIPAITNNQTNTKFYTYMSDAIVLNDKQN